MKTSPAAGSIMRYLPTISTAMAWALHDAIAVYADYPKPGVIFRDVMPACARRDTFDAMIEALAETHDGNRAGITLDAPLTEREAIAASLGGIRGHIYATHVVGIESRGLIFGAALATALGIAFVACRKAKERPWPTDVERYALEYDEAALELPYGVLGPRDRVVVVDDLMATGGSATAAVELCRRQGASVLSVDVIVELDALGGRAKVGVPVNAVLTY